jgi:hypothetical protein
MLLTTFLLIFTSLNRTFIGSFIFYCLSLYKCSYGSYIGLNAYKDKKYFISIRLFDLAHPSCSWLWLSLAFNIIALVLLFLFFPLFFLLFHPLLFFRLFPLLLFNLLLHPFQLIETVLNLEHDLVPFFLFMLKFVSQRLVLLVGLPHSLLVLICNRNYLFYRNCVGGIG